MHKVKTSSDASVIRVVELFAGVGGFRLGLQQASNDRSRFKVVFSNQWEPSRRRQHASEVYVARFGPTNHENRNIADIPTSEIPDHDLLVGGFPCQDYSVASTLQRSGGLLGKKGVLWWQIHRILSEKSRKPGMLLLENVDRLLVSPASQRGRDFAVMLRSLADLGYAVEWRVINAADYGMPQRRRRVFMVGHYVDSPGHAVFASADPHARLVESGVLARSFPCGLRKEDIRGFMLPRDLRVITKKFNPGGGASPFDRGGTMLNGFVHTARPMVNYDGPFVTLGDVLVPESSVPEEFRVPEHELEKWLYLKGAKREPRKQGANGHIYHYSEGAMVFPDPLDRPSRTVITGEGGRTPSRFKHVVRPNGRGHRRLTPVELERLNMFPDGHTEGVSDAWRAFFMGNALVVGVVERIGRTILEQKEGTSKAAKRNGSKRK